MTNDDMTTTDRDDHEDREIQDLLKDYPMPQAAAGFYDQALARATHEGSKRQRNRWLATGFGGAIAAGLALWMFAATFLANPDVPQIDAEIPGITIALEEPRTVNFVFSSAEALDSAMLTVSLPAGVELQGFPGQTEISWETSLTAGKNYLPLTLVAVMPAHGELLARLEHDARDRTFRLRVTTP